MSHPISDMLSSSMEKLRGVTDVNTVVGDPIVAGPGLTLIPVSKISYGYAGGGTDFVTKNSGKDNPFGGGSGCSVKVTPVAFLVIKGDNVRLLPVSEAPASTADRIVDMVPDLVDNVKNFIADRKAEKNNISEI